MGYLVNNRYSFSLVLSSDEGGPYVEVVARDFLSGEAASLAKIRSCRFQECYESIVCFLGRANLVRTADLSEINLIRHIKSYSDSLYGFHMSNVSGDVAVLEFFKEAYISCFALELSSAFSKLGESRLRVLMDSVVSADSGDEYYSERLFLRRYIEQWIFVNI